MKREEELKNIVKELLPLLKKYNNGQIDYQIDVLNWLLKRLNEGLIIDDIDWHSLRQQLYPPREGLTDFHIWNNDYLTRMNLNRPVDILKEKLWDIVKIYI